MTASAAYVVAMLTSLLTITARADKIVVAKTGFTQQQQFALFH